MRNGGDLRLAVAMAGPPLTKMEHALLDAVLEALGKYVGCVPGHEPPEQVIRLLLGLIADVVDYLQRSPEELTRALAVFREKSGRRPE